MRDDTHPTADEQRARLAEAREDLARTLDELARAAKDAARAARARRGQPDLPDVYARARLVTRAEEAVDFATLDVATAEGEDA